MNISVAAATLKAYSASSVVSVAVARFLFQKTTTSSRSIGFFRFGTARALQFHSSSVSNQATSFGTMNTVNETKEEAFAQELKHDFGLDICHAFNPVWYNDLVQQEGLEAQLSFLPLGTAYLIGNTKYFWPFFVKWYQKNQVSSENIDNPLDTYIEQSIQKSVAKHFPQEKHQTFLDGTNASMMVSMQRVGIVSGFSDQDPVSFLSIHPVYGTWHSYRAVVVLEEEPNIIINNNNNATTNHLPTTTQQSSSTSSPRVHCKLSATEKESIQKAMKYAMDVSANSDDLCKQLHYSELHDKTVANAWIALRDCVQLGKEEYRFDENQLLYHYTKDKQYIRL